MKRPSYLAVITISLVATLFTGCAIVELIIDIFNYEYTCNGGTPQSGTTTDFDNREWCTACNLPSDIVENRRCVPDGFTCDNGTPHTGSRAAGQDVERCEECDSGYWLDGASERCFANGTNNNGYGVHANGVTITCPGVEVGERFTINGKEYFRRDRTGVTTSNATNSCTTGIVDMENLLRGGSSTDYSETTFNTNIEHWDTSNATNMNTMFANMTEFNQNLEHWDTSNVTDMTSMFNNARAFNRDISGWDVGNVSNMRNMFTNAQAFNQNINGWNVSSVTTMEAMFNSAIAFNQDISNWNVSNITNMDNMFNSATAFNQDISGWCVSGITMEPPGFAVGANATWTTKPQWGSCP